MHYCTTGSREKGTRGNECRVHTDLCLVKQWSVETKHLFTCNKNAARDTKEKTSDD